MSDATYIELPPEQKKRPFFRTFRGWAICLFLLAVLVGAALSWWLAEGRIASAYARVDTNVYTVETTFPTTIEGILTRVGDTVAAGQALARIDPTTFVQPKRESAPQPGVMGVGEISGRLDATESTEKQMMERIAQARADEERFQRLHQDTVTDHVRAQLALRAMDRSSPYWVQASQAEAVAKRRMDSARENFEQVSKLRAALDTELTRIRLEIWRKKQKPTAPTAPPPPVPEPEPEPVAPNMLYAPVTGEVLAINAQPGQSVNPGEPVFTLLPTEGDSPRWIQAFFPLASRHLLKEGQNVQVRVGDGHYMGQIAAITAEDAPLPQGGEGRYLITRVNLEDRRSMERLKPGTPVECQVQTRYILGEQLFVDLF